MSDGIARAVDAAAFYEREGKKCWLCSWCGQERQHPRDGGSYVAIASSAFALVCTLSCEAPATAALVDALANHRRSIALGGTP